MSLALGKKRSSQPHLKTRVFGSGIDGALKVPKVLAELFLGGQTEEIEQASVGPTSGLLRPQVLEGSENLLSLLAAVQTLQSTAVVHQDLGLLGSELGCLLQDLGSFLGPIQAQIIFP